MILEAVRTAWELPLGLRLGAGAAVLGCGVVVWLLTVLALRRVARDAPWWAVDLSGVVTGLTAGFVVVLAAGRPGAPVRAELLEHDGELRLWTLHEGGGQQRVRVRSVPDGGVRGGGVVGPEGPDGRDAWTGRTGVRTEGVSRCVAQAVGAGCGTLLHHGVGALIVEDARLHALGTDGAELWSLPWDEPYTGATFCGEALCLIGGATWSVSAVAVDPGTGAVRWRLGAAE